MSLGVIDLPRLELTHIVLHHTAAEEKNTEQIRKYHKSIGWRDIGYDFVIEKDGKLVDGRSLSIQGAHAGVTYYNQHAIGIAVIGNLSKRYIYTKQYDTLINLLLDLMIKWDISINNILLHREIKNTQCPGNNFPKEKLFIDLKDKLNSSSENDKPTETPKDLQSLLDALQKERETNKILQKKIYTLENACNNIKNIVNNLPGN